MDAPFLGCVIVKWPAIAILIAIVFVGVPATTFGSCSSLLCSNVSAQREDPYKEGGKSSPSPSPSPITGQPAGERNPYVGLIAALAIVVVGVAGIFIYRLIREGL